MLNIASSFLSSFFNFNSIVGWPCQTHLTSIAHLESSTTLKNVKDALLLSKNVSCPLLIVMLKLLVSLLFFPAFKQPENRRDVKNNKTIKENFLLTFKHSII
jgi:hypothetical protein